MKKLPVVVAAGVLASFFAYFIYGYILIMRMDPYHLFYYAVFPEDLKSDRWVAVPWASSLAQATLSRRSDEDIRQGLARVRFVLPYFLAATATAKGAPELDRLALALKITESLMARGILSIDAVDQRGCSSLHNAIIGREWQIMGWLLSHGALAASPGGASASLAACRLPAKELLEERIVHASWGS